MGDKDQVSGANENDLRGRMQKLWRSMEEVDPEIRKSVSYWSKDKPDILELRESMEADNEFARWESELSSKLYYALWVLFIGGFVYSFNLPGIHQLSAISLGRLEIRLFRVIAIVGCVLNFYVQRLAVRVAFLGSEIITCFDREENLISAAKMFAQKFSLVELPSQGVSLDSDLTAMENYSSAAQQYCDLQADLLPKMEEVQSRSLSLIKLRSKRLKNLKSLGLLLEIVAAWFLILALAATWPIVS